jgi:hypothetical protein
VGTAGALAWRDAHADPYQVTIATGGVTGIYYQIGAAICRLIRRTPDAARFPCSVASSPGSVRNITTMRWAGMPFAIVQADTQYKAVKGTGPFAEVGPYLNLRSLFSVVPEAFTIVAAAGSGIYNAADLLGRRVNAGNFGSGTRATVEEVLRFRGWRPQDLENLPHISSNLQSQALCRGQLDALVFVAANPSAAVAESASGCGARLVSPQDEFINGLVKAFPYYERVTIPGGTYRNNPQDVHTFGTRATVVARSDVPNDVVYALVKSVFTQLAEFRRLDLSFTQLQAEDMVGACNFAPLHPGAERYFREVGLLPKVCPVS